MASKSVATVAMPPWPVEGEFTIYTIAALKPSLLAALMEQGALTLDLSRVTEMDSAGLQLLLLLKREADALHGSVQLAGISPAASEVLDLCNLTQTFVSTG